MIIIKYARKEEGVFFSHLDILRAVQRTISRANLTLNWSKGFNPTMQLFFSQPTPIGIESECEYLEIDTDTDAKEYYTKFKNHAPNWIDCLSYKYTEKKQNIAGISTACKYVVRYETPLTKTEQDAMKTFFSQRPLIINSKVKGEEKPVDITTRIYEVEIGEDLQFVAGIGNENVRVDYLCEDIKRMLKINKMYKIVKTNVYTMQKGELIDIDNY